jgi:3-hydroxybutyrate dehydrogenase
MMATNVKLNGHTALITGAASGIGRACARRLSAAGANMIMIDRVTRSPRSRPT